MLNIDNITLKIGNRFLLKDITFTLALKGITLISGENGSGKTQLLTALHGMHPPFKGRITWNGLPAQDTRKMRGFQFQNPPFLRRSVERNLIFRARTLHSYDTHQIEELIDIFNLKKLRTAPASQLSGGEKQRLALALALIGKPQALLLDEPTASLDREAKETILTYIKDMSKSVPIIMTSHDSLAFTLPLTHHFELHSQKMSLL